MTDGCTLVPDRCAGRYQSPSSAAGRHHWIEAYANYDPQTDFCRPLPKSARDGQADYQEQARPRGPWRMEQSVPHQGHRQRTHCWRALQALHQRRHHQGRPGGQMIHAKIQHSWTEHCFSHQRRSSSAVSGHGVQSSDAVTLPILPMRPGIASAMAATGGPGATSIMGKIWNRK